MTAISFAAPGKDGQACGRHPWMRDASWFIDATERLTAALGPEARIIIGLGAHRDRPATAGVRIDGPYEEDELDEMPGLRRLERRAPELAGHIPARPPFGARIIVTPDDVAVHLRWHLPGSAVLLSRRTATGWTSADMIIMPIRHLDIDEGDLASRRPEILSLIDRILGGGRIDVTSPIYSVSRREEEIHVVIGGGTVLGYRGSGEAV